MFRLVQRKNYVSLLNMFEYISAILISVETKNEQKAIFKANELLIYSLLITLILISKTIQFK